MVNNLNMARYLKISNALAKPHRKYPLIILSNRLPSADEAGGVVKLLSSISIASMSIGQAVIWAGPGSVVPDEEWSAQLPLEIRKHRDRFLLVQYPVPASLKQAHYSTITNGVLWAALHGLDQQFNQNIENLFGQANPEHQFAEAFAQYWQFNEIATQVIDRWIEPGGIVWCVDYQMVGVRSTIEGTRMMYSNCTPIPDIQRLSQMYVGSSPLLEMPDFKKWIEQLCQYNLTTLQRFQDLENLIEIGSKIDPNFKKINLSKNIYCAFGNLVRLIDIPIGQNIKSLREEATSARKKYINGRLSEPVKKLIDRDLAHQYPLKVLALVSRNDYTKGIGEAIAAVDAYFEMYSDNNAKFLFILQPARTTVVGYEEYHQKVDREIEKLKEKWAEKVIYVNQGIPHDELMLLLRDYIDFVLIMATYTDGHNLIAPEMLKISPQNSPKGIIAVEGAGMVDYIGAEDLFLCPDLSNPKATAAVFAEAITMPKDQLIARFNRIQQRSLRINDKTYFNTHINALREAEKLVSRLKIQELKQCSTVSSTRRAEADRLLQQASEQYRTSPFQDSLRSGQQALEIYREIGDRAMKGTALNHIGNVYRNQGDYSQALDHFQTALLIAQSTGDRAGEGTILSNMGNVHRDRGEYSQALDHFQTALSIVQAVGDRAREGGILNNIGAVYLDIGQYSQALDHYQQALSLLQVAGDRAREATILNSMGVFYASLGQYLPALDYYEKALPIRQAVGDRAGEGTTLNNMGEVYVSLGQYEQALNYYKQAISLLQTVGDRAGEGTALNNMGTVYLDLGQYPQALAYLQQSLSLLQAVGDRAGEGTTLSNMGWAQFKLGQLEAAETSLLEALALLDALRQQDLKDADRVSLFDKQVNGYTFLQQVQIAQRKIESALETAERGRARPFVALLSQRLQASDATTQLPDLSICNIQQTAKEQNATLVQYSLLHAPSQVNPQKVLQPSHLYIWVINPSGNITFRSVDLALHPIPLRSLIPLSRETLGVEDRGYSIPVTLKSQHPKQIKLQLQKLYQLLIAPIADLLPGDSSDRIVFIPQAELFWVPFAALRDPDGNYLIQTHTILTAPSIQVLGLTHQLQQARSLNFSKALIVGNPTMPHLPALSLPLPALPRAEQEAIAIAQQLQTEALIGDAATETAVVQRMGEASVIHLATHGLLEYGNLKASGVRDLPGAIVLASSPYDDGLLTSSKIFGLKLHASLVVLSACNTARGDITGDGVIGLSRALISAGASSVVVSLWKVADDSTETLMTEFYCQLQQYTDKAQALRQAMLKTMQQHPDPIDWAAFTLIGEAE